MVLQEFDAVLVLHSPIQGRAGRQSTAPLLYPALPMLPAQVAQPIIQRPFFEAELSNTEIWQGKRTWNNSIRICLSVVLVELLGNDLLPGVIPSALGIMKGRPPRSTAAAELEVLRSMPMMGILAFPQVSEVSIHNVKPSSGIEARHGYRVARHAMECP